MKPLVIPAPQPWRWYKHPALGTGVITGVRKSILGAQVIFLSIHGPKTFVWALAYERWEPITELGPQAQRATERPADYDRMSAQKQWEVDATLKLLDWNGQHDT